VNRFVLPIGVTSWVFGLVWLIFVTPFQWICATYYPPLNSLLTCPQVNFIYRWLEVPFLVLGIALIAYWLSKRRLKIVSSEEKAK
jgi:hypothetical protein